MPNTRQNATIRSMPAPHSAYTSSAFLRDTLQRDAFLRETWQRHAQLFRQAIPAPEPLISGDDLAALATDPRVESRIVLEDPGAPLTAPTRWTVDHGPFTEDTFATLPPSHWTLLVQAVDLWIPQASALFEAFDFLPTWRRDDVMVTYAAPEGGVGPHYDQYDVFLLQMQGQRRWRLGQRCDSDTPLLEDADLRVLQAFETTHDWVLSPGDVLYVPPGLAHWGSAVTESVTCSIGFRAPGVADLLGDIAVELTGEQDEVLTDPPLTPAMAGDAIDPAFIEQARSRLHQLLDTPGLLEQCYARQVTRPKYPEWTQDTEETRTATIGGVIWRNGEPDDPSP